MGQKLITLEDVDLTDKTVIHRCDFNIKLKKNASNQIVPISDVRLKAYFPSIFYLLNRGCKIVFMSYLERPGGKVVESLRTKPIADRLSHLINRQVHSLDTLPEPKSRRFIKNMKPGQMVMLENTRFYPEEEVDDDVFAQKLARLGEIVVQDAFGQCHRRHASVTGLSRHLPSVAGLYLQGEIETFDHLMQSPQKPLTLIIGGTKTYDKIKAITNLIDQADHVLVGGAVANNFLKAQGFDIGHSFTQEPYVDKAKKNKIDPVKEATRLLKEHPKKIIIPTDLVAADCLDKPTQTKTINIKSNQIKDWAFMDIGPQTINKYLSIIKRSKTIFWDGPMGKYEDPRFRVGTLKVAESVASNHRTTILAGGDTAALAEDFGFIFRYSHVSIAGGASLEYLSGKTLPGITPLIK